MTFCCRYFGTVKQDVRIKNGLQIIHVPAHRHLEEVELYIDFENDHQLVKWINENKCQLSEIDSGLQPISSATLHRRVAPLDSSIIQTTTFVRLEDSQPLTNLTYLRKEMQDACHSLPTYWVNSMQQDLFYSQRNRLAINKKKYLFPSLTKSGNSLSYPHAGGMLGNSSYIQCHPDCFYQICDPHGGQWCFYTATHCPLVTTDSWTHLNNIPLTCRPCCSSPDVPCNTTLPYCGCYAEGLTGK